ncbi:MAG: hypothetical protein DME18_01890 [Verrucomicrobia bacterium]|nr:MAG: hypothetical protein DME18_01890 [Verrucomicrobiota bacterium]
MSGYPHIDIVDLFNEVVSEHANAIILDKYLRERTGKDADFANADYVFHSEKVIAELKCLKNDNAASPNNQAKLTAAIDRFHAEGKVATKELNEQTWPTLPKELQNEVYNITTNAIRDRVAKANRQIRETKEKLGLTSYDGLLLIANDGIISLPPTAFIHSVARLLMNHFREIDCFIFFTANVFSAIIHSHASRLAKLVLVEARLESQRDSIIQPRVGPQRGTTLGHPPK